MNKFDAIINDFRKTISDDFIGLYEVISYIKTTFPDTHATQIMPLTLQCVHEMLAEGFKAGYFGETHTDFDAWSNQSPDYVIHRIQTEWQALGRLPNIGDIVYFDYSASV